MRRLMGFDSIRPIWHTTRGGICSRGRVPNNSITIVTGLATGRLLALNRCQCWTLQPIRAFGSPRTRGKTPPPPPPRVWDRYFISPNQQTPPPCPVRRLVSPPCRLQPLIIVSGATRCRTRERRPRTPCGQPVR